MSNHPFEPIDDPDFKKEILNALKKNASEVLLWTKDKKLQFKTQIIAVNKDHIHFDIPMSVDPLSFDSALTEPVVFMSLRYQRNTIFFKALYQSRDARIASIYLPSAYYKLQRRESMRVRISYINQLRASFQWQGQSQSLRILDISTSGIALLAKEDQNLAMIPGNEINAIQFQLNEHPIKLDTQLMAVTAMKDESGLPSQRLGLKFLRVSQDQISVIEDYVNKETQTLFSKIY